MAFFEGKNMTGGYGKGPDIINSCSVSVERGEIVSIIGPNGAGKSTAMKALLGLLNLKSGTVIIGSKGVEKVIEIKLNSSERKMFNNSVKSVRKLVDVVKKIKVS